MIDAFDHVRDDLARGIPDAEVLTKLGIEGFEEGFVKVLNRVGLRKLFEERRAIDASEGVASQIKHLGDLDCVERAGIGDFGKEFTKDGDVEVKGGSAPVEASFFGAAFGRTRPKHPGREDSVEESLHQSGTEEVLALLLLEPEAERLLKGLLDCVERTEWMVLSPPPCLTGLRC